MDVNLVILNAPLVHIPIIVNVLWLPQVDTTEAVVHHYLRLPARSGRQALPTQGGAVEV